MRVFKGYSTVGKEYGNFKIYDIELAKRDLLNEMYTRKGERLMSPTYGYIVWDVLFDPLTDDVVDIIREDTLRIISRDPRLGLNTLDVTEDIDLQTLTVKIILNYVPTATLSELTAVFSRDIASNKLQG
jgi:phage baseplate assembly protein W